LVNTRRAVICGAGIGGPALALWLRRIGWDAVLLEARAEPTMVEGAFLGVAPNGMHVLDALGLADAVAEIGFPCEGFSFVNHGGRVLGGFDRGADAERFGRPLTMIRRADLHRVLSEACERGGIEIRYGVDVERLHEGQDRVTVEGSGLRVDGEVVVGCDGLRSGVRASILPNAPTPRFSGLLDVGGFAPPGVELPFEPRTNTMVFGKRAFFGAFTTTAGDTWWFHNGSGTPGRVEPTALRERLLAAHVDDPPWVPELVRATPELLGPWGLYEVAELHTWVRPRVALLGDAAHAMSPSAGQGASLALEDAVVLAQCLRDIPEVAAALATYERLRRPRVLPIMRVARRHSNQKAPGAVGRFFRDMILPHVLPAAGRQQSEAYAFRIPFDRRVTAGQASPRARP
jgi:2-polyprenyl-6-methoxyphenol hydroxylase-like FAD-dependent oxidoreductase